MRGLKPESTRTNLQAIIERTKAKNPEVKVVIAGMQMPPNWGAEYVRDFQNIFPQLAKANQAVLIPFLLEGVGGRTDLNQPDRIHPTPAGHRIVADTIWKTLEPLLKEGTKTSAARF